ncbi:MAG: phosphate ABC transporter permease subunit PstC [Candidatus Brockarchaeota archaeon]|nr:phosphate ABC transporter permease subunit PstC [Candidatus Brockarchaeota archaeon]
MKGDDALKLLSAVFALSIPLIILLMVYELIEGSLLSIQRFGPWFIVGTVWDPVFTRTFGAMPLILGTLTTSAIALAMSVPVSIGIGLLLSEYAPKRFSLIVSFMVELLAAVPSVIYGLWGIFVLIPFLRTHVYPFIQAALGFLPLFSGPIYGGGVLTAGIVLAVMIIPIVSSVSRDVFMAVPDSQREAMLSLGATRWETSKIVMSYAKSGVIGAIILGLGRAIGETMAVTMVIGNKFKVLPSSLFDSWYTMAAIIANEFTEATYDLYVSALIEVGLMLFMVSLTVNMLARLIVWRTTRLFKW